MNMESMIKAAQERAQQEELEQMLEAKLPKIKVIGVGGAGGNTVMRLLEMGVEEAELIAVNTDAQDLAKIKAHKKILIGREATQGLGAGSDPALGEEAARENENDLKRAISGADLVFITCGLGGGTGSGAAPVVAELAKKSGALTIAVVTLPFVNEGLLRWENARYGLSKLEKNVDSIIIIPNQKLLEIVPDLPLATAFRVADEILANAIKSITRAVTQKGLINIDFADLRAVMKDGGAALIGVGESDSERRAEEATLRALNNPLLDVDITGAKAALIYVEGGKDMKLDEATKVLDMVSKQLSRDAKIIWGVGMPDESLGNAMRVLVIVTGANIKKFYYPGEEEMEEREKAKLKEELGIEFVEVEE